MIAVVNFGSQFTHLIARRLRALNVHAEIVPSNISAGELGQMKPSGIVLSGGPLSVNAPDAPAVDVAVYELGLPILGICYGEQLMTKQLGGVVETGPAGEYGKEHLSIVAESTLFSGLPADQIVWYSHGDEVVALAAGFKAIAHTAGGKNAAIADARRNFYGLQFHPEVVHSEYGQSILQNFALHICHDPADWTTEHAKDVIVERLQNELGIGSAAAASGTPRGDVLVGVSGGVDSMVAATLLHQLIPDRLHAVLVDHGLLRQDEAAEVEAAFAEQGLQDFRKIDASELFLSRLAGVSDPEAKRKIIGHAFIEVFEAEAGKIGAENPVQFLAQGTIYPDRIESAQPGGGAQKIKSHHNLTLPEKMDLQIIEPLQDLYKDEVRELGLSLGLPEHLVQRHPFPGPGLGIRILGPVDQDKVKILQHADAIYLQELRTAGLYTEIWQAFAALLPVQTVGVMGDSRTYEFMITLRAVNSVDGMTADWYKMPPEVLERISSRIVNEVRGVNRVVYDVTQKPPGTIEYE